MRSILLVVVLGACAGEEPAAPVPVARVGRPSADEVRRHVAALEPALSRASADLVAHPMPGGGVKVYAGERFQSAVLARTAPNGRLVTECVESAAGAEGFLGADLDEGTK